MLERTTPDEIRAATSGTSAQPVGQKVSPKPLEYKKDVELEDLPEKLAKLITDGPPEGEDRSTFVFVVCAQLRERGHGTGDIAAVIAAHPEGIGERYNGDENRIEAEVRRIETKLAEPPEWVQELNSRYFISQHGEDACVFEAKEDITLDRVVINRLSFGAIKKFYDNKRVEIGKKMVPKGTAWLFHPQRREYLKGMRLCPGQDVQEGYYNLWTGWGAEPKKGDWSCMRRHIEEVICGNDAELINYVRGWLAYAVQHPDRPGEVALVLRGGKGTGKGTFGHYVGKMFGQHYLYLSNGKHLTGNFNAHLRDAVFVFADEALFAGDRKNESVLKSMITDDFLTIEGKGRDVFMARNYMHILMASNSDWVVPASSDERRFCVLDVSDSHRRDEDYFAALRAEMEGDGPAAMLHDLLAYDLRGFSIRAVPHTRALLDQKLETLTGPPMWLYECLKNCEIAGYPWTEERLEISVREMHPVYCTFHQQHTYGGKPRPPSDFSKSIRNMLKDEEGQELIQKGPRPAIEGTSKRKTTILLPPLAQARAAFAAYLGSDIAWEGTEDAIPDDIWS